MQLKKSSEQNDDKEKSLVMEHAGQKGLNNKMPTIVFFFGPTNLSHFMYD
jgi:hypothetical protein